MLVEVGVGVDMTAASLFGDAVLTLHSMSVQ